jgi:thioredoxin-like negative regulator of GroEL
MATTYRLNLAAYLTADGRFDEALAEYRKGVELSPNAVMDVNTDVVRLLILQRRYHEAQAALAQVPEGKFRDHGRALLYALPARRAEADAALLRLAAAQDDDTEDIVRLAEIYAFRGMNDQAFAVLQKWKESLARNRDSGLQRIWSFQEELRITPFLKPLHADPRWAELLVSPYAANAD